MDLIFFPFFFLRVIARSKTLVSSSCRASGLHKLLHVLYKNSHTTEVVGNPYPKWNWDQLHLIFKECYKSIFINLLVGPALGIKGPNYS